jgi:hypothetical protein
MMQSLRPLVLATAKFGSKVQSLKAHKQLRFSSTSYPTSVFRAVHSSLVKQQGPVAKAKEEEKVYIYNRMFIACKGGY